MKKIIFTFFIVSVLVLACNKEKNCANAELCVKNETGSVVHYAWRSNIYTDSVMPGGTICTTVGELKTRPWGGTYSTTYLNTDHGSYAWDVTRCHQKESIY